MSEELKSAQARIACLEGEIAKRDEELAACRVAVENCELFRARIVELESRYQRDVYGLNNEGDPIGGDPAGGYANDNARLRTELAALKAQEPVGSIEIQGTGFLCAPFPAPAWAGGRQPAVGTKLYAAPVSEAKAQGVVMPEPDFSLDGGATPCYYAETVRAALNATPVQQVSVPECFTKLLHHAHGMTMGVDWNTGTMASYHREPLGEAAVQYQAWLAAAPAAPAADAGIVDMYRHLQKVTPYRFKKIQDASITDGGDVLYFHKDRFDAALLDDMAANCAKESK